MGTIPVMINGLPGRVAAIIAGHMADDDRLELMPWSLTGPEITESETVIKGAAVRLIRPDERESAVSDLIRQRGPFISVDYTHPTAVNDNGDFYCRRRLPFVMGTTGGNRRQLTEGVVASDICAVIAPNMAKQVVGFQAMMAHAAENFPDMFRGYTLTIVESHQHGKADTSGTAREMVKYFQALGLVFAEDDIVRVRDPDVQEKELGVPREHLNGHGWHTYTLVSPDRSVTFEFTHNINGRDIYAEGTIDAVLYLAGRMAAGDRGRVFTMIDVLRGD